MGMGLLWLRVGVVFACVSVLPNSSGFTSLHNNLRLRNMKGPYFVPVNPEVRQSRMALCFAQHRPRKALQTACSSKPIEYPIQKRRHKVLDAGKKIASTSVGVIAIFALERMVQMSTVAMGLTLPSAPVGMLILFTFLLLLNAISQTAVANMQYFFGPSLEFYRRWVPLFFSAPLVDLPLSLIGMPLITVSKILSTIIIGTVFTCVSTAVIVSAILKEPLQPNRGEKGTDNVQSPTVTLVAQKSPWPLAFVGMLVACGGIAVGSSTVTVVALSVAALQAGLAVPSKIRSFLPPIVSGSVLISALLAIYGHVTGAGAVGGWMMYRTSARLGVWGPGDYLLSMAAPAVVALGFRLFEQRKLLKAQFIPLAGGAAITTVASMAFTLLIVRMAALPAAIGLALVPRFITLPVALPVSATLSAITGVTALSVVIEGVIGANSGLRILDKIGARNQIVRGMSMGACAHALGVAACSSEEPEIAPAAAVTFLLTACYVALLANTPPVRALLLVLAGK